MTEVELPMPLYTMRDVERITGLRKDYSWILAQRGKIETVTDDSGMKRVTPAALERFIASRNSR